MKSFKRIFIVMMILAMFMTTAMTSFAAIAFTDVSTNYWGRPHIEKMADNSIVSGMMENGKLVFKPEAFVSRVQALQMIFRTLRATDRLQSTANFTNKYEDVMASYNIPEWAYEAVAYALEYEILTGNELANLMKDEQQVSATRQQVAVYLGKAIDTDPQGSAVSSINFVDRELIDAVAMPYVELLVTNNIISGDDKNYFNPRNTITRAQMAAICSKAFDYLEEEADIIVEIPVNDPVEEEKTETKIATIIDIRNDNIFVRDNNDNVDVYTIENNTEFFLNGSKTTRNNVTKDRRAHFTFNQEKKLIKIEINPSEDKYEGFIDKINRGDSYDSITVRGDYGYTSTRTFRLSENTEIRYENKSAHIRDLSTGDQISVVYEGDRAVRIEAYSPMDELVGILEASISYTRYPFTMQVRTAGNQVRELEISDGVRVRKDDKTKELTDLSRGDIVSLQINGNRVTRIDAISVSGTQKDDKGVVQSIILGNPNKITIVNEDNDEFTYDIDNNVTIYIDDTRSNLYDLRVGYEVELEIENNRVIAIEADKVEQRNSLTGEIVSVHDSINRIVLKVFNDTSKRYEDIPVYINKNTNIIDEKGKSIDMGYLDRRDEVFVSGKYEEDVFVATRIIILNN
ncbi:S-layer homology domain-containing protein [Clostridium formicaceticum]|uniref:SLH domain-containing protein n=1 Tax=Clostridium formicaceticum TaxID=1497 RepID=A0AAC9RFL1_9CLOT|nr:S-layer homology domain-containing protein [Clostridium formicaceticum]AOY75527.1 hypothetical protein BJL90_06230 [Clostridium formicaceticum]ARE85821.1 hypothetical protein CLFO_01370 [Clostridium formicaceticum]